MGIANSIAFGVLFAKARLFADAGLQGVYLGLGVFGGWQGVCGGPGRSVVGVGVHRPACTGVVCPVIVVVRAESTGTTSLAEALADGFGTSCMPEYGREYCAGKLGRGDFVWRTEAFFHIAREQTRRETDAAGRCRFRLICYTNAFATALWHRRYMGFDDPELEAMGRGARADLYILTDDEIPFIPDGLWDGEHIRGRMHGWFEEALRAHTVPWLLVNGSRRKRLEAALGAVNGIGRSGCGARAG